MPKNLEIKGNEFCIDSDKIMNLKKIPKKLSIVGSGYIAVEFAFIFSLLGSKVNLICRKNLLRGFDESLVLLVKETLEMRGVNILLNKQVEKITKHNDYKKIYLKNPILKSLQMRS